jgi:hypothetical protein
MAARSYSYRVVGISQETGRRRTRTYLARSESAARCLAEADKLTIESVDLLPPELPTEAQLGYARDLQITIPDEISKDDLSELIGIRTNRDKPPRAELREFAEKYGVFYPDMTGKKSLFNRIFWALKAPGRETELCAWFAYRVYRSLINGSILARVTSPFAPEIQAVASQLAARQAVVDSICHYDNGADFIWFGTWTAPDGVIHAGGSMRTIAYQEAVKLLQPIVAAERAGDEERMRKAEQRREANFKPRSVTGGSKAEAVKPRMLWRLLAVIVLIAIALVWHYR